MINSLGDCVKLVFIIVLLGGLAGLGGGERSGSSSRRYSSYKASKPKKIWRKRDTPSWAPPKRKSGPYDHGGYGDYEDYEEWLDQ